MITFNQTVSLKEGEKHYSQSLQDNSMKYSVRNNSEVAKSCPAISGYKHFKSGWLCCVEYTYAVHCMHS